MYDCEHTISAFLVHVEIIFMNIMKLVSPSTHLAAAKAKHDRRTDRWMDKVILNRWCFASPTPQKIISPELYVKILRLTIIEYQKIPFCCHLVLCSCFQSTQHQQVRQTESIFCLCWGYWRTHGKCWPAHL